MYWAQGIIVSEVLHKIKNTRSHLNDHNKLIIFLSGEIWAIILPKLYDKLKAFFNFEQNVLFWNNAQKSLKVDFIEEI